MVIKRKIFAALAALALASGIAATAAHSSTASASGPIVATTGSSTVPSAAYEVESE